MSKESRVKKSFLNARMNLICYMTSLLIVIFTRKIFLDQLGTEFIGFTGTLQSILGFLNLAELGVGTAIGYVLYKPIYDNDKVKINEIISVFGYLYRCIGLVILGAGVILSIFLPWIFPNTSFSWFVIYLGFYAYLTSSLLGYFINYRQTLLSADQRNYEVMGYYQAVISTKMLIQMFLALYIQSFIIFLCIELLFSIVYSCILTYRINKVYPWLNSDIRLGKQLFKKYPEIGKYVKQLFIHKIGGFFQGQTTPLFIYSFVSLPLVALYTNYTLLTYKIQALLNSILDSTAAGVGNLISEGNNIKIWKTYQELFSIRAFFAGIGTFTTYYLLTPFIQLWLGNEYILDQSATILILIQLYLLTMRGVTDQFLFGYGLFYDVWAPLTESIIFVITATIGGYLGGLHGVLCAPLISLAFIVYGWKPYFLFKKGLKHPLYKYWIMFFSNFIICTISYIATTIICELLRFSTENWKKFILTSIVFIISFTIICTITTFLFNSSFRSFIYRFIKYKHAKS